jgi:hypothetical protein
LEIREVIGGEVNRHLHGNGRRVVEQHKALEGLMPLDVGRRDLQGEGCQLGRIVA